MSRVIMEQDSEIDLSRFVLNMLLSIDSERIDFHSEMKGSLLLIQIHEYSGWRGKEPAYI